MLTIRTHYRIRGVPPTLAALAVSLGLCAQFLPPLHDSLVRQGRWIPWMVVVCCALIVAAIVAWYARCRAVVTRNVLLTRSVGHRQRVELTKLVAVEMFATGKGDRTSRRHKLVMRLEDATGAQVWLPLDTWRDEEMLLAYVLQAAVRKRLKVDGDPDVIDRFSGLLERYRSYERPQLAA